MKTTERFDKAVMKLYNAFHSVTLDTINCKHCAVGNIVGSDNWADVIDCGHGGVDINKEYYDRQIKIQSFYTNSFNRGLEVIKKTGYTPFELMNVEAIFMSNLRIKKDEQFERLCAVVEYLAELDRIPNPMEIMKMFKNKELIS